MPLGNTSPGLSTGGGTITPRTPGTVGLRVAPPAGATALATDELEIADDVGDLLVTVDATGNVFVNLSAHAAALDVATTTGSTFKVRDTGAAGQLGFYNHATVSQQTGVAVTAAAIHAALVNLGLITA